MAHDIIVDQGLSKSQKYDLALQQLIALTQCEENLVANLANTSALLKDIFGWFWVGFYLLERQNDKKELVLSAFQGSMACTRIGYNRGVCGTSWALQKTLIVEDVEKFKGHIACSSLSRSEIVVPIFVDSQVIGVLDVDSTDLATFDIIDQEYLEQICHIIANFWK